MADIFLSYSRDDLDRVRPLVTALEKEGFSVWWDRTLIPGEQFAETIDREIQSAACVVVVWSESSVASQWVKNEALDGMDRGVLVPILLDRVRLPVPFKQHQIVDFTNWPRNVDTEQYQSVVDAIFGLVRGEIREPVAVKGIGDMASHGRRRYRRRRDYLLPALVISVLALSAVLLFESRRVEPPTQATRLTIDRFSGDGSEQSDFYADSITHELQLRFAGVDDLKLVQVGSLWDLDLLDVPDLVTKTAADFILSGQVHMDGDTIHLQANLRDAPTGDVIWQGKLSDDGTNLIELQQNVIKAVLGELKMASYSQLSPSISRPVTDNKLAYRDYLLGQDLLRRGEEQNLREAIGRFRAAVEKDKHFSLAVASTCRAYLELFKATRAAKDYAAGKESCEQVLAMDEPNAEIHLALAELYRASGETESAKLEYLEALKLSPGNPDAGIGLADVLVQEGNMQGGEELYLRSARENPTYWKAHNSLGTYYFRQGMFNQAIESYTRTTELMSSNATAFNNLGAAKLYAGDFEGASRAWRKANALDTNSASYSNLGTALYHAGKFKEALEQFQAALAMDPGDHRLWGNVADNLRFVPGREGEASRFYREAIRLAKAVIEVNPDDAYTLSRLAVYCAALDDTDDAREFTGRAQVLAGFDLNVLYDLAVASKLLGDDEKAQAYVSKALNAGYPAVLVRSDPQLITTRESQQ